MVALQGLQDAQARWAEQDLMNQLQVQHHYAGEAYERLKQAEMKWHEALHHLEMQRQQTVQIRDFFQKKVGRGGLLVFFCQPQREEFRQKAWKNF